MTRIWNFSAGPAAMPEPVLRELGDDLLDLEGTGIGILEHSHRQPPFDRVLSGALDSCRRLGGIPDSHDILFVPGGATVQFALIPLNLLPDGGVADYPDTDVWTAKAIVEGRDAVPAAQIVVPFEGKRCAYDHVPSEAECPPTAGAAYLHYCSNNTVHGTQYHRPPRCAEGAVLINDASSEIFSRPVDWSAHGMVYASGQKNLGVAGMSVIIVRRDLLERAPRRLRAMFSYAAHAKAGSRINTPPTFAIHTLWRMCQWMIGEGGVAEMERRAQSRARMVQEAIDASSGFYRFLAQSACRSVINASFRLPTAQLDERFWKDAAMEGIDGLAGHREAGGIRASMYNSCPLPAVEALVAFMREFNRTKG